MKSRMFFILMFACVPFTSNATWYPSPCSFDDGNTLYSESSAFVRIPSNAAGCVGAVPGALIGGILGLPFGEPKGGAYVGAVLVDNVLQAIVGAPLYVIEYIPRKILEKRKSLAISS